MASRKDQKLQNSVIRLFLCGDIMTGRGIDQVLPCSVDPALYESYVKDARDYILLAERANGRIQAPVSFDYLWGDALKVWEEYDPLLKIINLETSITNNGKPCPEKAIHYRMHPGNLPVLTAAGIDAVTLANNHILDWEREGLANTLESLNKADIAFSGAGVNRIEASQPIIFEVGESRILIFAYGAPDSGIPKSWSAGSQRSGINFLPDLSPETLMTIGNTIKGFKKTADLVIFSIHWGSNWGYDIPDSQVKFAHSLIEHGYVDIVFGHSSHHPRPLEVFKDKLIINGAGDFINDYEGIRGKEMFRGDLPLMYFPEVNLNSGDLLRMTMVPMKIRNFRLHRASPEDAQWLQKVLDKQSRRYTTGVELRDTGTLTLEW